MVLTIARRLMLLLIRYWSYTKDLLFKVVHSFIVFIRYPS